ncbi:MAG: UDP-N-acetylmuramoyl-L-alanine--D-glutamate ligase [Gammaproteobacteria bacterium]|nr:UDP-N-acetylmuramoyl-L-alanine--D-glutamate ligase [Gammaproteobacteria bacterium]
MTQAKAEQATLDTLVVGLGQTGLACARFLAARGERFAAADSRANPPGLDELRCEFPDVECHCGAFDEALLRRAKRLLLSPGVAPQEPAIVAAQQAGAELLGDIELFARHADAPVVAITGSNGKSTVTTLVGEMAKAAGRVVQVGGNLGTPALALLSTTAPDLYVLELSSFQLELTSSLNAAAAVVLNISEDHLDRHGSVEHYAAIKATIYRGDGAVILNRDDAQVMAMALPGRTTVSFGLGAAPTENDFGLLQHNGSSWLGRGNTPLLAVQEMKMPGRHNWANALAALALGGAVGLEMAAMLKVLRDFPGLPHRCQWVAEQQGVNFYEDSKGTNVGATLAALEGMPGERVVLIAGGQGKGQEFLPLRPAVAARARAVVLLGEDAALIEQALVGAAPLLLANDMADAVAKARRLAEPGDAVLLSPACASFDMFRNYVHRGEAFVAAVLGGAS